MVNLVKQLREKISGLGQRQDEPILTGERRIPSQQTESLKGEKKSQNWFQSQISSLWNWDNDSGEGSEYEAAAVAATAFAITTLEEAGLLEQKKLPKGSEENSLAKTKSIKKDTAAGSPDSSSIPGRLTSKEAKKDKQQSTGETKSKEENQSELENAATRPKMMGKGSLKSETRKDALSRPHDSYPDSSNIPGLTSKEAKKDKQQSTGEPKSKDVNQRELENASTRPKMTDKGSLKSQTIKDALSRPHDSYPEMPTVPTAGDGMQMKEPTKSDDLETKADAWEEAEMAKITKWYEKMNSTIFSWENEKKAKAKSRKYRRERALEQKRARASQEYSNEVTMINKIARGAREITDKRKRKDESKTHEKVKKIRLTGKVPHTCFCF